MSKTYLALFKVLGSFVPVMMLAAYLNILGENELLRVAGFIVLPPVVAIASLILWKRLDSVAKLIGLINAMFVIYQVTILVLFGVFLRGF